ncbi:MAG TPA: Crp/Fnr family transcriptional regulator [Gemmataceae bacterium]|nr:Crp/Fnr family transcriptional regulator [Gemmataceae bacterium]
MSNSVQGSAGKAADRPSNNLLAHLSDNDFALLAPHLEDCQLSANENLYNSGDRIATVYFPCGSSLVSHLLVLEDGRAVETLLVGREGAAGQIMGPHPSRAYSTLAVKFGGAFVKVSAAALEKAKITSSSLREVFDREVECLLARVMQAAACNAVHSVEQRTAKWIIALTAVTADDEVRFTQEQLAAILGVNRSYAARVIQKFKADHILQTRRRAIQVLDPRRLQAKSCRCHELAEGFTQDVLAGRHPSELKRKRRRQLRSEI